GDARGRNGGPQEARRRPQQRRAFAHKAAGSDRVSRQARRALKRKCAGGGLGKQSGACCGGSRDCTRGQARDPHRCAPHGGRGRLNMRSEEEEKEIEATKAPLLEHLIELRARLIKALIAFAVAFVACFFFAKQIYNVLVWPFVWVAGVENSKFIYTALLEY